MKTRLVAAVLVLTSIISCAGAYHLLSYGYADDAYAVAKREFGRVMSRPATDQEVVAVANVLYREQKSFLVNQGLGHRLLLVSLGASVLALALVAWPNRARKDVG